MKISFVKNGDGTMNAIAEKELITYDDFQKSVSEKIAKVKNHSSMPEYEVLAKANLNDEEIYFIAWCECNNDRVDMEWEGFYRTDQRQQGFVKEMFEAHKKNIRAIETTPEKKG